MPIIDVKRTGEKRSKEMPVIDAKRTEERGSGRCGMPPGWTMQPLPMLWAFLPEMPYTSG